MDHCKGRWNNYKGDVRKAENGNMENVKNKIFYKVKFYRVTTKIFLKMKIFG